jgi:hypothetical protein
MSSDLLTRLRRTVVERDTEGEEYHVPVNPDGPPAADRIEADARRIAELEGLVKWVHDGSHTGGHTLPQIKEACGALLARMGGSDGSA